MPRDLTVTGIAVRVTGGCPPCEGPDPCSPCPPSDMMDIVDAAGGPPMTAWVGMVARNLAQVGHRYVLRGQVDPSGAGWVFSATEMWEVPLR